MTMTITAIDTRFLLIHVARPLVLVVVFLSVPFILPVVILSGGVWGNGYGINTHGNASVEMVKTHTICDNMQVLNTNTNIFYYSLEFIWIP